MYKLTNIANGSVLTFFIVLNGSDGAYPYAGVILDSSNNIYGTAAQGGVNNNGTLFEITH